LIVFTLFSGKCIEVIFKQKSMILLAESQYFPSVTFINAAINLSHVDFVLYEPFQKMSFRNRCVVAGSNGRVNLSIPLVEGRNQRKPTLEVRIDNRTRWQSQHWKTITSCYNRSPWFEFYKHGLGELYRQPVEKLTDWNRRCWEWLVEQLGVAIKTRYLEAPLSECGQEYLDWRNKLLPRSIEKEFPDPLKYRQVFEDRTGFIPHLSGLDLLFCVGPASAELLRSSKIPT
jgi:hypothetical protein